MQQAAIGDCLSFDPFPFDQNGLAPPEVDVGGRQIADAFVIAQVIVVNDEGLDLGFCGLSPATAPPTISEARDVKLQGFLAHRSLSRSEDETEIRAGEGIGRKGREGHPPRDAAAFFSFSAPILNQPCWRLLLAEFERSS